jgi:very-short-patch-repair endonuclease
VILRYSRNLKDRARELRNNPTDAERLLWSRIRGKQIKGYRFYRQKPVGNYIVDFCCPKACLVIEVDGGQHYREEGKERDRVRDDNLRSAGLRVLRYSDRDVLKRLDNVLEEIWECVEE